MRRRWPRLCIRSNRSAVCRNDGFSSNTTSRNPSRHACSRNPSLAKGRIREQHVAAPRPLRHLEEVEHDRIRAAAILDVAGKHGEPSGRMAITRLPLPQNGSQTALHRPVTARERTAGQARSAGCRTDPGRVRTSCGRRRDDWVTHLSSFRIRAACLPRAAGSRRGRLAERRSKSGVPRATDVDPMSAVSFPRICE